MWMAENVANRGNENQYDYSAHRRGHSGIHACRSFDPLEVQESKDNSEEYFPTPNGQAGSELVRLSIWGWKIFFAVVFTLLNLQGIKTSARVSATMAAAMSAVVVVVFVAAIRYILGHPHSDPGFFTRPFYDPQTFTVGNLFGCTSLAVL